MSVFERLLVPGCTELPACRCGQEMDIASIERLPEGSDAAVRVYRCPTCSHEMRLTVWATDAPA
jgi:DNA-directed RNA polymerase subunit RPC12/RpoP